MFQSKGIKWLSKQKKQDNIQAANRRFPSDLKTHRLKVRDGKKIFYENGKKKMCIAMLISDEICFKDCIRETKKKRKYTMVRDHARRRYEIINKYAPNRGTPKHKKQMLTGKKQVEACSQSPHLSPSPPHTPAGNHRFILCTYDSASVLLCLFTCFVYHFVL